VPKKLCKCGVKKKKKKISGHRECSCKKKGGLGIRGCQNRELIIKVKH